MKTQSIGYYPILANTNAKYYLTNSKTLLFLNKRNAILKKAPNNASFNIQKNNKSPLIYSNSKEYTRDSYITNSGILTNIETAEPWWKRDAELWEEIENPEEFEDVIKSNEHEIIVVDWFATWCHGCRRTSKFLSALASDPGLRKRVKFVKACVDSMVSFARGQGAIALPYLSIYNNKGQLLIGFGAGASKHKSFKINILTILDNPGKRFRLDPLNFVVALEADLELEREEDKNKEMALNEMKKFKKNISKELEKKSNIIEKPNIVTVNDNVETKIYKTKKEFLNENKEDYGYNGIIDDKYYPEIGCRMGKNEHYLDYTGSSLYCQSQLEAIFDDFKIHTYGNPHSMNPSSSLTQDRVDKVRKMVLDFFNADPKEYQVIFTKSATSAFQLIGETYPWSKNGLFMYLRENHNSILGIREYVLKNNSYFKSVSERFIEGWLSGTEEIQINNKALGEAINSDESTTYNLFAYPAEDNFAGVKYPLRWIKEIKNKSKPGSHWHVLLDAAAFVPTQPLDLSEYPADFVALSFYKLFGYPTGLGALISRIDSIDILKKVFWAGGSVALSTSKDNFHVLKCRPSDRLEDGTVAFLDIISLEHGFKLIESLGGVSSIQRHVTCLTEWLYRRLSKMRHSNGSRMLKIFGKHQYPNNREVQGSIVNFEILSPNGDPLSYKTFEKEAASAGFHLRTGSECNPGAAYNYLEIYESEIEKLAGSKDGCEDELEFIDVLRPDKDHYKFDSMDLTDNISKLENNLSNPTEISLDWIKVPLGSIRVSLGYMSTFEDCYELSEFIEKHYRDRSA